MVKEGSFIEFPAIETKRLILRKLNKEDAGDIFSIFSYEEVVKYYGMYAMKDISEAENLILKFNKSFDESSSIRWGIELKDEKKIIGTCGYHGWNKRHMKAEIGYELNMNFWKNGYAKEAVLAIIEYGFNTMNLERVEAVVYPQNSESEELLKSIDFEYEGCLRKYAYFRDKHEDLNMFSLLK